MLSLFNRIGLLNREKKGKKTSFLISQSKGHTKRNSLLIRSFICKAQVSFWGFHEKKNVSVQL